MKKSGIFYINGEKMELPIFEKGDRVKAKENSTTAIQPTGTVESTRENGLFVNVKWDKEKFPSKMGGFVELGQGWMVNSLETIQE